jgi:aminoglycoside phosphotransferase (APT) family kinase protein
MSVNAEEQRLLAYLETTGGGTLLRSWPLNGGISASMTAFEVELPDGRRRKLIARRPNPYRFRQNPDAAAAEFRVLRALRAAGLPVQEALYPEPRSEATPEPCLVIEYVEGRPELDPAGREGFLLRYAAQLAQIHRVDPTKLDLGFLPTQMEGYGKRRAVPNEALREGEICAALEAVRPNRHSNPTVLLHGDFWPGNVVWRDGEIAAVIDWEECLIGEPLSDVAICRLDLWWVLGEAAAEEFTAHYQASMNLDMTDLPYWDLCASLRPIANLERWADAYPRLGRPDVTAESMRRDHQAFVVQALAKLATVPS